MAKLQTEHILTLTATGTLEKREPVTADEGKIVLREPTNKEWNAYDGSRFEFTKKGRVKKGDQSAAKCELFDQIVTDVQNIEDGTGAITLSDLARIPARYKQRAIFMCFEDEISDDDEDSEKN